MRRTFALLTSAAVAITGLSVVAPGAAEAATSCVLRPVPPARIAVNQSVIGLKVPLSISGPADCRTNVSASTYLVHGTDSMYFYWLDTRPYTETIYGGLITPGTYRSTGEDCDSYDADYNAIPCTVVKTSTVIKYAGRASLTAKRKGKRVTLTARTGRFDAYNGSAPVTAKISIQRLSGKHWKTIKHATAKGKKGYTWSFTKAKKARYRVVSGETGAAFAAVSRSTKK